MALSRLLAAPEMIGTLGRSARELVEVFTPNANRSMELDHAALAAALGQFSAEFTLAPQGRFDRLVNAMNRLPRPMLALGTLGLFLHAMIDPESFIGRMQGLGYVPEPLWWLLGAIVAFYFGARETHYRRIIPRQPPALPEAQKSRAETNPALEEYGRQAGNQ